MKKNKKSSTPSGLPRVLQEAPSSDLAACPYVQWEYKA